MANALVSATALVVGDRAADLVVTALAPDPAAPVVMAPADLAATIVVAMIADLPVSKTLRSSVPSSPARSSPMTRSLKFSVAR
jgi:hypothetical protein